MKHCGGLRLSIETTQVRIVDENGQKLVSEKTESSREAIAMVLECYGPIERAGPHVAGDLSRPARIEHPGGVHRSGRKSPVRDSFGAVSCDITDARGHPPSVTAEDESRLEPVVAASSSPPGSISGARIILLTNEGLTIAACSSRSATAHPPKLTPATMPPPPELPWSHGIMPARKARKNLSTLLRHDLKRARRASPPNRAGFDRKSSGDGWLDAPKVRRTCPQDGAVGSERTLGG